MGLFGKWWDGDDEFIRDYAKHLSDNEDRFAQQMAAQSQAQVNSQAAEQAMGQASLTNQQLQQAMQDSVVFGQGQIIIGGSGSTSSSSGISGYYGGMSEPNPYRSYSYAQFTPLPPDPYADANEFIDSLSAINPDYIKEIVVMENIFMQILGQLGTDLEKNPDAKKELTWALPYGTVILKNEKFQFDLDRYLEDGDTNEI